MEPYNPEDRKVSELATIGRYTCKLTIVGWEIQQAVPFLGQAVSVTILPESKEQEPSPSQIAVLHSVESLAATFLDALDDAAEAYRKEVDDAVDLSEYDLGQINRSNIRKHYALDSIVIPRHGSSPHTWFFIAAECDWEEEHGMETLVKDGAIISCGMSNVLYLNEEWDRYIEPPE